MLLASLALDKTLDKSPTMQNFSTYKKVDMTIHYAIDESIHPRNPWSQQALRARDNGCL
jgi:hypothetical protein